MTLELLWFSSTTKNTWLLEGTWENAARVQQISKDKEESRRTIVQPLCEGIYRGPYSSIQRCWILRDGFSELLLFDCNVSAPFASLVSAAPWRSLAQPVNSCWHPIWVRLVLRFRASSFCIGVPPWITAKMETALMSRMAK